MSYRVGLSGGIGSGKSTVAAMFQELGVQIVDSDVISHRLTQPGGDAIPLIREAFGADSLTPEGAMDRPWMRRLVFDDDAAKSKLEAILHPLIRLRMLQDAEGVTDAPYLVLVVPLLFEAPGFRQLVHRTLVVDCPEQAQVARTMARSGLSREEVLAIMSRQLSRPERLRQADDVVRNDAGVEQLRARVQELHRQYLGRASGIPRLSRARPQNN